MPCVVTIDGPAGAGKSTVARLLADRLGWRFLDTGAMYRAVTLAAIRDRVDLTERGSARGTGRIAVRQPAAGPCLAGRRRHHTADPRRRGHTGIQVRRRQPERSPAAHDLAACVRRRTRRRHRRPGSGDAGLSRRIPQILPDGQRRRASPAAGRRLRGPGRTGELRVGAPRSTRARRSRCRPSHRPHEARRRRHRDRFHRSVDRRRRRPAGPTKSKDDSVKLDRRSECRGEVRS